MSGVPMLPTPLNFIKMKHTIEVPDDAPRHCESHAEPRYVIPKKLPLVRFVKGIDKSDDEGNLFL